MNITPGEVVGRKVVGKIGIRPVYQVDLKGGLIMIVSPKGKTVETLGTGAHRLVARVIAKRNAPDVVWTELLKSEELSEDQLAWVLPGYVELTNQFRALKR